MMKRILRKHSLSLILCCLSPAIAGPGAGWIGPQAKPAVASGRVKLNFTAESEKFDAATEEYRGIWQTDGAHYRSNGASHRGEVSRNGSGCDRL